MTEEITQQVTAEQEAAAGEEATAAARERHAELSEEINGHRYRYYVLDGGEVCRVVAGDLLGRRVGRAERGVALLEALELAHQPVELGVGDGRRVQHVVAVAVAVDLLGEPGVPLTGRGRRLLARRGLLFGRDLLRDLVGHPHLRRGPSPHRSRPGRQISAPGDPVPKVPRKAPSGHCRPRVRRTSVSTWPIHMPPRRSR